MKENQFRLKVSIFFIVILMAMLLTSTYGVMSQPIRRHQNSRPTSPTPDESETLKWFLFRSPDGDFTIEFPAQPKRIQDIQGAVTVVRQYTFADDTMWLGIAFEDYGGMPDSPENNDWGPQFEENFSRLSRENGTKIVQFRRLTKSTYELEAWTPASTPSDYQHYLTRATLRNARAYRMACHSLIKNQKVDKKVCRRFFKSFRILGQPH